MIVLHPELDADLSKAYLKALQPAFGTPKKHKSGMVFWTLEESDVPPIEDSSETNSLSAEEPTISPCVNPAKKMDAIKQNI